MEHYLEATWFVLSLGPAPLSVHRHIHDPALKFGVLQLESLLDTLGAGKLDVGKGVGTTTRLRFNQPHLRDCTTLSQEKETIKGLNVRNMAVMADIFRK